MSEVRQTRAAVSEICERLAAEADGFRALDAELGDGDLGITVGEGCAAVRQRLATAEITNYADLFREIGQAFANANPSTLANLVGIAMRRVARAAGPVDHLEPPRWSELLRAAMDGIQQRGGAVVGNKTILDALDGSAARLAALGDSASGRDVAEAVRAGAAEGAAAIVGLPSQIGRASWQGDRSRGARDPGAELWVAIAVAAEQMAMEGFTPPEPAGL